MSPRTPIVLAASLINGAFLVFAMVVHFSIARDCANSQYGCEGYNYMGAALAFLLALGPGTAFALVAALLVRGWHAVRHTRSIRVIRILGGFLLYAGLVALAVLITAMTGLNALYLEAAMVAMLPMALLRSTASDLNRYPPPHDPRLRSHSQPA